MGPPQPPVDREPGERAPGLDDVDRRPSILDLTLVLPTIGRPVLRRAVRSIAEGTHWPSRFILVDQSEDDLVEQVAEELALAGVAVDRITAPRRGVAAGRNRGIERVVTRWFVITDDDHCVADRWLHRMHHHLEARSTAVVTGMVSPAAPGVPSSTTDETPAVHVRPLLRRDPLFAGNMGTSLEVAATVGPFDERDPLEGAEDNDWGYRAMRLGVPIVYAPDVKAIHLDWRDEAGVEETYRRYARAQGAFYGKHLRHADPFIALRACRDLARGPWLLARGIATGNAELTMFGRSEVAGILPGLISGLRMRGRSHPVTGGRATRGGDA